MKLKKALFLFIFTAAFFFLFSFRINADTLLNVYLEYQISDSLSLRCISTVENLTDLNTVTEIEMNISLLKENEEIKNKVLTTETVYSSVSGTNGKEAKDNTYYSVLTLNNLLSYPGYTLSVYYSYLLEDSSRLDTNTITYKIPDKIQVSYNMNGGHFADTTKAEFTIDYFNDQYWNKYKSSIFLYDNDAENSLAALYSKRIGINLISGTTYQVSHIYNPKTSDKNAFSDDYAIVIHTENSNYELLDTIEVGDTVILSEIPAVKGAVSVSAEVYDDLCIKEYSISDSIESITEFNITYFDAINSKYNTLAATDIMLNDNTAENALGAKYAYRVSMDSYNEDSYIVKKIYDAETDYNINTYDYTIVTHSDNAAGYKLVKKISVGDIVEIKNIPSSAGTCSLTAKVYDKDLYDSNICILETPVKEGYTFSGWYESSDYSGNKIQSVKEDTTLYAKWEADSYDAFTLRSDDTSYIYGNDVSYYQGTITASKYKANSNFMIARIGYTGTSGGRAIDEKFTEYVSLAVKNDIPLGAYFYSLADSVAEAQEEASWVISQLSTLGYDKGTFSYPIYMDYEDKSLTISGNTKAENTAIANAFAETLIEAGYYPGLYVGASDWSNYFNQEDIICDVWVARYLERTTMASAVSDILSLNCSSKKVTMIQFDDGKYNSESKSGTVLGTENSYVDQDVCFVDYPSIIKSRHFNGY